MEQGQLLGHSLLLHPNHLHPLVRASAAAVAAARAVTAGAICSVAQAIKCAWIKQQSPLLVRIVTYARMEELHPPHLHPPHHRHLLQLILHLLAQSLAVSRSLGAPRQTPIAAFGKMLWATRWTGSVQPEHLHAVQVLIRLRPADTFSTLRSQAEGQETMQFWRQQQEFWDPEHPSILLTT